MFHDIGIRIGSEKSNLIAKKLKAKINNWKYNKLKKFYSKRIYEQNKYKVIERQKINVHHASDNRVIFKILQTLNRAKQIKRQHKNSGAYHVMCPTQFHPNTTCCHLTKPSVISEHRFRNKQDAWLDLVQKLMREKGIQLP